MKLAQGSTSEGQIPAHWRTQAARAHDAVADDAPRLGAQISVPRVDANGRDADPVLLHDSEGKTCDGRA